MQTKKKRKAFTLTELVVVIAIIGILAAVLIPSLTGYIAKSKKSKVEQEAASIVEVVRTYNLEIDAGTLDSTITSFNVEDSSNVNSGYYYLITGKTLKEYIGSIVTVTEPSTGTQSKKVTEIKYSDEGFDILITVNLDNSITLSVTTSTSK